MLTSPSSLKGPLTSLDFRLLWCAMIVTNLGSLIQAVGAGWMMATISQSDSMVALVQSATALPVVLFSIAAGALADNSDRKRVVLASQLLMFSASVALTILAVTDQVTPWLLLAATFLMGFGNTLNMPAWQASIFGQP